MTIKGFNSEVEARGKVHQVEQSPFYKMISGSWYFKLMKSVDCAISLIGSSASDLKSILVPGHWQLQHPGDIPIYTNFKYIIPVDPPNIPSENPSGYYQHSFFLSSSWEDRRIILSFGGVDSSIYVWCNSTFIGVSKDSRLPVGNLYFYLLPTTYLHYNSSLLFTHMYKQLIHNRI
jgi:beta-galactosidase/evolved beta-galactosidase subunit alpha